VVWTKMTGSRQAQQLTELSSPSGELGVKKMRRCSLCGGMEKEEFLGTYCGRCEKIAGDGCRVRADREYRVKFGVDWMDAGEGSMLVWQKEIEHAIDNAKRTEWGKQLRSGWYKAAARRRWTKDRKARWADWREQHSRGEKQGDPSGPDSPLVDGNRIWVKGHVPEGFLEWAEKRGDHDENTELVLDACCFEEWKRPSSS